MALPSRYIDIGWRDRIWSSYLLVLRPVCMPDRVLARQRNAIIKAGSSSSPATRRGAGFGMRLGIKSFGALHRLPFMDGLLAVANEHPAAHASTLKSCAEDGSSDREGGAGRSQGWETAGDEYLERLESLAESAVSVEAWRKGLGSLSRTSLNATRKVRPVPHAMSILTIIANAVASCASFHGLARHGVSFSFARFPFHR